MLQAVGVLGGLGKGSTGNSVFHIIATYMWHTSLLAFISPGQGGREKGKEEGRKRLLDREGERGKEEGRKRLVCAGKRLHGKASLTSSGRMQGAGPDSLSPHKPESRAKGAEGEGQQVESPAEGGARPASQVN